MKPVGILGGTFDPVHFGHLQLASESYKHLDLGEVRLVPLFSPPHRPPPVATPEQRLIMLQIATTGITGLTIDDCELKRKKVSYTIDTLISIRANFPGVPLCLIMGADAFNHLHTWRRWAELLDHAHIVVVHRPGCGIQPDDPALKQLYSEHQSKQFHDIHQQPAGHIFELSLPLPDISSTQIRTCLSEHRDPSGLLPDAVIDYIQQNNIYPART